MRREMLRHESQLPRRRTRAIHHQMRGDPFPLALQFGSQNLSGHVTTKDADEQAFRSETSDIARHVACTADDDVLTAVPDYRRRSLWRDARHVAVNEVVEHQVAD